MSLSITVVSENDQAATVAVEGDVDASNAHQVLEAINDVSTDLQTCTIDLTAVGFIDSSGINALVVARRDLHAHAVVLHTRTSPAVHRVLAIAGVVEYLGAEANTAAPSTALDSDTATSMRIRPPARLSDAARAPADHR